MRANVYEYQLELNFNIRELVYVVTAEENGVNLYHQKFDRFCDALDDFNYIQAKIYVYKNKEIIKEAMEDEEQRIN